MAARRPPACKAPPRPSGSARLRARGSIPRAYATARGSIRRSASSERAAAALRSANVRVRPPTEARATTPQLARHDVRRRLPTLTDRGHGRRCGRREAKRERTLLAEQHHLGVMVSKAYFFWHTYWRSRASLAAPRLTRQPRVCPLSHTSESRASLTAGALRSEPSGLLCFGKGGATQPSSREGPAASWGTRALSSPVVHHAQFSVLAHPTRSLPRRKLGLDTDIVRVEPWTQTPLFPHRNARGARPTALRFVIFLSIPAPRGTTLAPYTPPSRIRRGEPPTPLACET
eukprot:9504040-Pyramimonas_sp.AAC.1